MWRKRIQLWSRYTGASVVAGIISEIVFVVTYWFAAAPWWEACSHSSRARSRTI